MPEAANISPAPLVSFRPRTVARRFRAGDQVAQAIVTIAAASIALIALLLVIQLWSASADARHAFGLSFLFTSTWDPVQDQYGALPFIFGTIVSSFLALLIAVPIGLGAAIFLAELAPRRVSNTLTFFIELLAAVPSVVYGFMGIFILWPILKEVVPYVQPAVKFIPLFSGPFYGASVLAAGIILAIMIVPFIVSVSREVLMAVPMDQREGSFGLGATRWETTWRVIVPYARTGIFGSIFLALARALGETMAVTMVIGNVPQMSASLMAPGYTIAAGIANEFNDATGLHLSALVELGLVLFALTILINAVARLLILLTSSKGARR